MLATAATVNHNNARFMIRSSARNPRPIVCSLWQRQRGRSAGADDEAARAVAPEALRRDEQCPELELRGFFQIAIEQKRLRRAWDFECYE